MRVRAPAAACALLLLAAASPALRAEPLLLRYGLEPGQRWSALQTIVRETQLAGDVRRDRATARFAYQVATTERPDRLRFDARMLSQTLGGEQSPFDFSVIAYQAALDARGALSGVHFQLGEAEPPDLPGVDPDPVAFQQMLRRIAEAWQGAVYWLPELPERALEPGDAFTIRDSDDVGGTDPGVRMRMVSTTTYTLREVQEGRARFELSVRSTVEAATAQSAIESRRRGSGEAIFDLALGMWVRHETADEHMAVFSGAPGGPGDATGRTLTTIEMRREEP
jgi:hypothetical protein